MRRVLDFALRRPASAIPPPAMRRAALLLLDTMGVCAAATPMQAARIARQTAVTLFGAGAADVSARLLFDGRPASLAGAAFAAATQIDNLDAHDGYNPSKGHIGAVAVPTLAVLAEGAPALTGRDALAALILGYEIAGRAGTALHASVTDYHTSGAWNALGVAAMAARLRGMDDEALRHAFGIAEYHGPRSQMMREIATPNMLHDGSGWGALTGLSAAIMAEAGFTGAPAITIEAADARTHWADLEQDWQVLRQYIKPHPTCRWSHAAIEIRAFDNAVALFSDMPRTTSQAQYSLAFGVATMLAHGRIGLEHISGDGLRDPVVAGLVARASAVADPRHQARYPAERWSEVVVTLTDGRVLRSGDTQARGGPEPQMAQAEVVEKFMAYAAPTLGDARAAAIRDAALGLDAPDARFSDLAAHLHAPV